MAMGAFTASTATAHLGAPEGRLPFVDDAGVFEGGATTWGIVLFEDEQWVRTCEESVGGAVLFYHRGVDGLIYVGSSVGLLTTTNGCSYDVIEPIGERTVASLATALQVPSTFAVATADSDGDNRIWRTEDDGQTFVDVTPPTLSTTLAFTSLSMSADGQAMYATGVDYQVEPGDPLSALYVSLDGGQTWTWPAAFSDDDYILSVGVNGDRVGLTAQRDGATHFFRSSLDVVTPGEPIVIEGTPLDWRVFDDAEYFVLNRQTLHMSTDGDTFAPAEGPSRCLLRLPGDARLWGCGQPFQLAHFLSTTGASADGGVASWDTDLDFLSVVERRCPAGTVGEERCAYLFAPDGGVVLDGGVGPSPSVEPSPGPAPEDEPEPEPEPEPGPCGCQSTQGATPNGWAGGIALWVAGLLLHVRRKRRVSADA